MIAATILVLAAAFSEPTTPTTLRYLRPAPDGWACESEIAFRETSDGFLYESRTFRGRETMTLTVRRKPDRGLVKAEVVQVLGTERKSATILPGEGRLFLNRDGRKEAVEMGEDVIFTTAPDWTDILELVRRYDPKKGGKQEFPGCWFHPSRKTLMLKFTIEPVGRIGLRLADVQHDLVRYRIRLRSGNYSVWALTDGKVCKILPEGSKGGGIVLEGFEKAADELR